MLVIRERPRLVDSADESTAVEAILNAPYRSAVLRLEQRPPTPIQRAGQGVPGQLRGSESNQDSVQKRQQSECFNRGKTTRVLRAAESD